MRNVICKFLVASCAAFIFFSIQSCKPRSESQRSVASLSDNQVRDRKDIILIKGGTFMMGTEDAMPYEAPAHEVTVKPFWMDRHEVTVAEFAAFVAATGYQTDAEKF